MFRWRIILYPFSLLYGTGVWLRNRAFDGGLKKSVQFALPVICIGNLEVGGAGKTPMTEYLIRLLKNSYKISTLSRGYGRKTKGFLRVDTHADASQTGDEPAQLKAKFPEVNVTVDEDRVHGIGQISSESDVIILDDAYQHRAVSAGLNILLFDYRSLQNPKLLLPAGNWRDLFSERKRADVLVVTKCPGDLGDEEKLRLREQLQTRPDQQVFFSTLKYSAMEPLFSNSELKIPYSTQPTVYLLTGIANPAPLASFIAQNSAAVQHHRYADHHAFTKQNITKLVDDFRRGDGAEKIIVTTEKDARRLMHPQLKALLYELPVFVQPVQMDFLENGAGFDLLIGNYVSRNTKHS